MRNVPGIEEARNRPTTRIRSVPPHMSEPHISLYMLNNEKERLEKEGITLNTRMVSIVERLKEIGKEMGRVQRQDKKAQKRRKSKYDEVLMRLKKVTSAKEPKHETGWQIRTLKKKGRKA